MDLILYTNKCLACKDKAKWQEIKNFAKEHKLRIRERRTTLNSEWVDVAKAYDIDLPFAVHNGIAIRLDQPLEILLSGSYE